jgi:hypothetical protein
VASIGAVLTTHKIATLSAFAEPLKRIRNTKNIATLSAFAEPLNYDLGKYRVAVATLSALAEPLKQA